MIGEMKILLKKYLIDVIFFPDYVIHNTAIGGFLAFE
jgi:hypothetical protein